MKLSSVALSQAKRSSSVINLLIRQLGSRTVTDGVFVRQKHRQSSGSTVLTPRMGCVLNSVNTVNSQCIYLNKYSSQTDLAQFLGQPWLVSHPLSEGDCWLDHFSEAGSPVTSGTPRYTLIRLSTMDWLKTEASQKPFLSPGFKWS